MFAKLREIIKAELDRGEAIQVVSRRALDKVLSDAVLNSEVVSEAIEIACAETVRASVRDGRSAICRRADLAIKSRQSVSESLKERVTGLMDFRLPGGKPLRESTGTECLEAATFYFKIAETNRVRGVFLSRIADKAKGRRVGEVLSENICQKIYKEAKNESIKNRARAA